MLKTSAIYSIMNMKVDIYIQKNSQSTSGTMSRKWVYEKTIPCKVMATKNTSGAENKDSKNFKTGPSGYTEQINLKMQSPILLSKRWRVSGIRTNDGKQLFIENDLYGEPDTFFEVVSNHPVVDPFGKISYYEVNLRRAAIQSNDTDAV